jgi:hypothetical protein
MNVRSKVLMVLVAGVAAVVLSTSVAFAKPLSEQQWRKQANVFCKQNNKEMNALSSVAFAGLGPNDQPTPEKLAAFTEQAVPAIEQTIASIDALNEPKALKKDVKKLVALGYDAVAGMRTNPGPENDAQFARVNKIGKRLGLVCGQ